MHYSYLAFFALIVLFISCESETGTSATVEERDAIEEMFGDYAPSSLDGYISSDSEAEAFNTYLLRIINEFDKTTSDLSDVERIEKQVELSCYLMSFVRMPPDTALLTASGEKVPESGYLDSLASYLEPILTGPDSFYVNSDHFAKTIEGLNFTITHRYTDQENWSPGSKEHLMFIEKLKSECPRLKQFLLLRTGLTMYIPLKKLGRLD